MSKETDIEISVKVKDGPKTEAQKTKLPKDYCPANVKKAINEELVLTGDSAQTMIGKVKFIIDDQVDPKEVLAFVAIHADQYTYKDSCGKDKPGIWYCKHVKKDGKLTDCGEFLDGPHVYISRRLQEIDFTHLHFKVSKEMFECITDPDKKKIVVNVTYGVGKEVSAVSCKPCQTPEGNAAIGQVAPAVAAG